MEPQDSDQCAVLKGRDNPPSHCLFRILPFSLLLKAQIVKCGSEMFEAGGLKWRLYIYPSGCTEGLGNGHISIYVELCDTNSLLIGWEVHVILNFFIFNHLQDKYFSPQDARVQRFHALKKRCGIIKFVELKTIYNPPNGYLIDDTCVFGAEIFVVKSTSKMQSLFMKREPADYYHCWQVNKFSTLDSRTYVSKSFGTYKWKIVLYPNGFLQGKDSHISLFLSVDKSCIPPNMKLLTRFILRIKDQTKGRHFQSTVDQLCVPSALPYSGFTEFMLLTELNDPERGFLVNDTCIIEAEVTLLGLLQSDSST